MKDYFKRTIEKPAPQSQVSGDYWKDLEGLCRAHVPKTIEFFRAHGAERNLEWAEPRYAELTRPEVLARVIAAARAQLLAVTSGEPGPPAHVGTVGEWFVCLTVFPSAADADFLRACPSGIEAFLAACRRRFHQVDGWQDLHYAQWILLADPARYGGSVHLFTQWSARVVLEWIAQMHDNMIEGAPTILPMDLLGQCNVEAYLRRMVVLDLEAPSPGVRQVATQAAKLLFTDSIVSDSPIVPFNPLEYRGGGGAINLIERLVEAHREDCERLQVSVPLIIGVADEHAEAARSGVPHPFMYFDTSLDVRVRGEACVPLLDGAGELTMGPDHRIATCVHGGGMSLAALIEDGTLSTLWKSGIRWLVIGQVFDAGLRLTDSLLESMARCETDGVFEVVKREAVPESRLAYLMRNERPFCVDDRRLRKPEYEALRLSAGVGTGTFCVRCDRLAAFFGISPEMLDGEWNADEWTGKIGENLQATRRLLLWGDQGLAFVVPVWEALSKMNLTVRVAEDGRLQPPVAAAPGR